MQVQIRRDTKVNWESENPILETAEFGLETNTGRLKIGNGTDNWNNLDYFPIALNIDSGNALQDKVLVADGSGATHFITLDHNLLFNYDPNEHVDWTTEQVVKIQNENIAKPKITQYCYDLNELGIEVISGGDSFAHVWSCGVIMENACNDSDVILMENEDAVKMEYCD